MKLEQQLKKAVISYIDQLRDDLVSLDLEEGISNEEHQFLLLRVDSISSKLEQSLYDKLADLIYTYRAL